MHRIPLCDLPVGGCGLVCQLDAVGSMRRRLLDLGLTPQSPVGCVGRSPHGDPTAYRVRQTVIALRRQDAMQVWVYPIAEEAHYGTPASKE